MRFAHTQRKPARTRHKDKPARTRHKPARFARTQHKPARFARSAPNDKGIVIPLFNLLLQLGKWAAWPAPHPYRTLHHGGDERGCKALGALSCVTRRVSAIAVASRCEYRT